MSNKETKKTSEKVTPLMSQYFEIKKQYPEYFLFFRMGDFYELFFEDAVKVCQEIGLFLTHRGTYLGQPIPMCGVPFHSYESYMTRLVKAGFKIAICEQLESPEEAKKRKEIVRRGVVRLVTAGTLTEDALLSAKKNNYLSALVSEKGNFSIAWADLSTGDFFVQTVDSAKIISALTRFEVSELLLPENLRNRFSLLSEVIDVITPLPDARFEVSSARKQLNDFFEVSYGFDSFSDAEICSMGTLIDYILLTQRTVKPKISFPKRVEKKKFMEIDLQTRRSLELISSTSDDKRSCSLLNTIDYTLTGAGGRLLSSYLQSPLLDIEEINERLDKVGFFIQNQEQHTFIREKLKTLPDIERSLSRLSISKGRPEDIREIGLALDQIPVIRNGLNVPVLPYSLEKDKLALGEYSALAAEILSAIKQGDLPALIKDGDFIQKGYCPELDEIIYITNNTKKIILDLQAEYSKKTGIPNLKIVFNSLSGYYVEVPAKSAGVLLNDPDKMFIHKQTMVGAVRFITERLTELEYQILKAKEKQIALEVECYEKLRKKILDNYDGLKDVAAAFARLDVATGLAECALCQNWTRPEITDTLDFEIKGGRHPVVEQMLKKQQKQFIPNDCHLGGSENLWLITGPNMSGKSTFLRQNALIAILAQMGSFVPADSAKIGLVNRLFSRVGASDDLARGRSTFMVEMVEVATILNEADEQSLVILDEVGRGTATYDGLSLAWSVVEYLCTHNKCRALFATHYHELTILAQQLSSVALYTIRVKEWQGDIVFLHEIVSGAADRSYGIHVAKLAGLPAAVLHRANTILQQLEKKNMKTDLESLPLFSMPVAEEKKSPVQERLADIEVDSLTPRQALEVLYELKELTKE